MRGRRAGIVAAVSATALILLLTPVIPAASATPTIEAWVYPSSQGQPACDTQQELSALSASPIAVLKPEYLVVTGRGQVKIETSASLPCNGFSASNLAAVRSAAAGVLVTVSAGGRATRALLASPGSRSAGLSAIQSFVTSNALDGADLDFEPNSWTQSLWAAYLAFVSQLVSDLARAGRTVDVDMYPFTQTPYDAERYGAMATTGANVVVMAYDHEYDTPCAPISPYAWLRDVVAYAQSQVPAAQLTIGIPAYGYMTTTCKRVAHITSNVAYVTMEHESGFPTTPRAVEALRDPASGEIRWTSGGTTFDYVDSTALDDKLAIVEAMGVDDVSVWSLGGEPWFNGNPSN